MTSFFAFSDTHCPLQDDKAVDWMLMRLRALQPDVVVHLGDGHESDAASKFPTEAPWTLKEEFDVHNNLLRQVREAAPNARRVFLPGNHDANLLAQCRIDKRVRDLCDYRLHEGELEHWQQPCGYIYDRKLGAFKLGQVTFFHGYEAGVNSDEAQALTMGIPYGLTVSGHTHRPTQAVTQACKTKQLPLPYWYANTGTLRRLHISGDYLERKRHFGHGQAIAYGECEELKSPRLSIRWTANVEVFQMADESMYRRVRPAA